MRRSFLSVAVLALGLVGVILVPQRSVAAPLPADYAAAAGGDLAALYLDDFTTGPNLSDARLAATEAKMNGGTSPSSTATASNLGAALTALGIAVQSNTQTAPPDHTAPTAGPLVGASSPGLFDLAPLNSSIQARTEAAVACAPGGGMIANAQLTTGGAILSPTGIGTIADTGNSTTAGEVSIVPEPAGAPFNRALVGKAAGTISNNTFLDGSVRVAIVGESTLRAVATGEPGGADVSYTAGTVTVDADTLGPSAPATLVPGESVSYTTAVGQAVVTVNEPTVNESPDGRTATGSVSVVTVDLIVGSGTSPLATARVHLLPLRASAVAPDGGIDCAPPAPVLVTPADGAILTDTTPTFTGTATPDADVDIFLDGNLIGTTTATSAGSFSLTPGIIPSGSYEASARARVNGATSGPSNINAITILGPPVLEDPADGTVTNDTTPTFAGTTLPGAQVDVLVDGNPIGTTTANSAGDFSFTPATPIPLGDHLASARASLGSATSGVSNVNAFAIDTEAPAAPTLVKPTDGSVTNDRTPLFTGRAEPGAEVEIFVDGTPIGTTTANGDGDFSFVPTTPLPPGTHEAFVGATDAAGNDSPPSNTNGFRIDTDDPAAPAITSPPDGGSTTDPTPTITGTAEPGSQVIILIDGDEVGETTADENGNFSFTVPEGLSVGEHEVSAVAVDEAGNRSEESDPVSFGVLAARADAGQNNSLAQTGGPQGWLPAVGVLGLLAGAAVLTLARWRRRGSHV